jgi:uncharacterized protein
MIIPKQYAVHYNHISSIAHMTSIKDPVHGYIDLPQVIRPILDSRVLQRLRYIRQLGFSYLVYPGANHSRFEHSLGTLHLASLMAVQLDLNPDERTLVQIAALLHDVCHGPFSHAIETHNEEYLGKNHTDISRVVFSQEIKPYLHETGTDPAEISALVSGTHPLASIIHGDLDVDRMDYLLRDAYYTGVPYGTVDADRLIRSTCMGEDGIFLDEGGIQAAESLLIARTLMRPAVYFHHVSRIAEKMFQLSLDAHIRQDPQTILPGILVMDDASCIHSLMTSDEPVAHQMANRLYYRHLYKRALFVTRDEVHTPLLTGHITLAQERAIAEEIAEKAGVEKTSVLVDIPEFPHEMMMDVHILNFHDKIPIEHVSPLTTTLNETRRSQWRLGVYTTHSQIDAVSRAARDVLHTRPITRQERLI